MNRSNYVEKQTLGMFISTIPMRVKVDENIKFIDLARNISSNLMTIFSTSEISIFWNCWKCA